MTRSIAYDVDPLTGLTTNTHVQPQGDDTEALDTTIDRNGFGQVVHVASVDRKGNRRESSVGYDSDSTYPVSMTNALGLVTTLVYHPGLGLKVKESDQNGLERRFVFDRLSRLRQELSNTGFSSTTTYSPPSASSALFDVTTIVQGGATTTISYDPFNREIQRSMPAWTGGGTVLVETKYDAPTGQIAARTVPTFGLDANTPRETFNYDTLGRLSTLVRPNGETITRTYTFDRASGLILTRTSSPSGQTNVIGEDEAGRIKEQRTVKASDPMSGEQTVLTSFTYGPFELPTVITVAGAAITSLGYDDLGRRTTLTDPDIGSGVVIYDAFGDVVGQTAGTGTDAVTVTYRRDELGRVFYQTAPEGTVTYDWDSAPHGLGKVARANSADGVETVFEYDVVGRPLASTWNVPAAAPGAGSYRTSLQYDSSDRLQSRTYPAAASSRAPQVYRYTYGPAAGTLDGVVETLPTGVTVPGESVSWAATGRNAYLQVEGEQVGSGLSTATIHDPATGDVQTISSTLGGSTLRALGFQYTVDGNLRVRSVDGAIEEFSYDTAGRLSRWQQGVTGTASVPEEIFTYDDLGSLTKREKWTFVNGQPTATPLGAVTFTPGVGNDVRRLMSSTFGSYGYDSRGNQLSAPSRSTTYTSFNLPQTVRVAGELTQFLYDAFGQRIVKSSATETVITVSGAYEERQLPDGSKVHVYHVIGDGRVVAEQVLTESGGRVSNGHTYYLHGDHKGSIEAVTNETGGVVARNRYDVFGGRLAPVTATQVRVGYDEQDHDDEIGLINMNGRVYDPQQARFVTPDPIVAAPFWGPAYHRYAYVHNNPLNWKDPTGFSAEPIDPADLQPPDINDPRTQIKIDDFGVQLTNVTVTGPGPSEAAPDGIQVLPGFADDAGSTLAQGGIVSGVPNAGNVPSDRVVADRWNGASTGGNPGVYDYSPGHEPPRALNTTTWIAPTLLLVPPLLLAGGEAAASAAALRALYVARVAEISLRARLMVAAGTSLGNAARWAYDQRNEFKLVAREASGVLLSRSAELINLMRYGNTIGPSFEALSQTRSMDQIIDSAGRTNATINAIANIINRMSN